MSNDQKVLLAKINLEIGATRESPSAPWVGYVKLAPKALYFNDDDGRREADTHEQQAQEFAEKLYKDEAILRSYQPTTSKRRCAFCRSRACYERVATRDMAFDEVACRRHASWLHRLSDLRLPDVTKVFITSTGYVERGGETRFDELIGLKEKIAHGET